MYFAPLRFIPLIKESQDLSPSGKNILLVNPWIMDFKAFDLWMKPLGLLYLASILEKNGFNITLLDCLDRRHPSVEGRIKIRPDGTGKFCHENVEKPDVYREVPRKYKKYGIREEVFRRELDRIEKPRLILVTSIMTYWYRGVHRAIEILKEKFPGVPLILGGIYASLFPSFARACSGADRVVDRFNPVEFVKMAGELTETEPAFLPESFLSFPPPAFHLYRKLDYYTLLTSRGCPYNCSYCASKTLYGGFLQRDPGLVVDEILTAHREFSVKNFAFYDDALLVNGEKHIIPILERIAGMDLDLKFFTPNGLHARFVTPRVAELMHKCSFSQIRLSLETSDEKLLRETGGKVTGGELNRAVENLEKAGYNRGDLGVYIMMGIPGQSFEECTRTVDFLHDMGVQVRISDYSPVPGTMDFEKVKACWGESLDDPLLHNNTFHHYFSGGSIPPERKEILKEMVFDLNKKILHAPLQDIL